MAPPRAARRTYRWARRSGATRGNPLPPSPAPRYPERSSSNLRPPCESPAPSRPEPIAAPHSRCPAARSRPRPRARPQSSRPAARAAPGGGSQSPSSAFPHVAVAHRQVVIRGRRRAGRPAPDLRAGSARLRQRDRDFLLARSLRPLLLPGLRDHRRLVRKHLVEGRLHLGLALHRPTPGWTEPNRFARLAAMPKNPAAVALG